MNPPRPAGAFLRLLGGRWTLAILGQLAEADCRYQELLDTLNGVSHKVLTDTLRRAERDGLITRNLDPERIESTLVYRLTPLGRSIQAPLALLDHWVERNWSAIETARQGWDKRASKQ
jgi:DNA-binding HxlR family transcriptional regulator